MYENMDTFKLRQLHFHLKNNESFLRFHRPEKYGDNLSKIRATVSYVNQYKKKVTGFEEGRIYNGYRFVYPLFYNQEYLGSVETSISMFSIVNSLKNLLHAEVDFILDKNIVLNKVFKSEQINYSNYASLEGYVIDKEFPQSDKIAQILQKNTHLTKYHKNKQKEDVSSFYDTVDGTSYIVSIIAIKKALSDTSVAYLVVLREYSEIYFIKIQRGVVAFILILLISSYFILHVQNK